MTPRKIDRRTAEAMGYPTIDAAEFELAEHIRYLIGDPDALWAERRPAAPGAPPGEPTPEERPRA